MRITNYSILSVLLVLCVGIIVKLDAQGDEVCTSPVDIFFLIDGSGSLGEEEFVRSKQLVSEILTQYDHSEQNTAGYAVFTSSINNVRPLTKQISFLLVHLRYEQYPGTSTDLYNALEYVYQNVFTHSRGEGNTRLLVVFTDGKDERNVAELSRKLEVEKGVRIIVFAFGNDLNQEQLEDIATDPDNSTLFTFSTVSEGIDSIQMLNKAICPEDVCCKRGKQGNRGIRGLEGITGDKGDMGRNGICKMRDPAGTKRLRKGEKGFKGKRGPQGVKGIKGIKGEIGIQGFQGEQGDQGEQGFQGIKGDVGEKGSPGVQGSVGPQGQRGEKGGLGIQGEVGVQGLKGIKGEVGPIGVCRNSTFDTEFSCKGQKGEKGVVGLKGTQGPPGLQGDQGQKGNQGNKGQKGGLGERGLQGDRGDRGDRGDPVPYVPFNNRTCTEPGSLFFDSTKKHMYYCDGTTMTHKCIGPGATGSCHDCQCLLGDERGLRCNTTRVVSSEASDCNSNVAVDFVVIVDDSHVNYESQKWVEKYLPLFNEKLLEKCIGRSAAAPNLVQLIAFGAGAFYEFPHFVTPEYRYILPNFPQYSSVTMRMMELQNAINNLQNQIPGLRGYIEPGYSALKFALDHAILRNSTNDFQYIPMFIFVTDEQTNDYSEADFSDILDTFKMRSTLILDFIVNPLKFNTSLIDDLFGVAYSNTQELTVWSLNDTNTEKSTVASGSVQVYPREQITGRNVKRDYMDLAICTQRTSTHVWNMEHFLNPSYTEIVSNTFLKESTDVVIERAAALSCQQCYCNEEESATCIQLEEKLLCDCITNSGGDRRCPCVREEIQNILEGKSQLSITEVKLKCNIESPQVDTNVCRGFLTDGN